MAELKRVLGYPTIISLAIASIMGTGLFFGTRVAAEYAGNSSLLSWAILSIIALYISTIFGELSSMFPHAGGVYEFSKQTYGRFFSFLVGWLAWLVGIITMTLLVVAAIEYLLPDPSLSLIKLLICVGILLVLNIIAYMGIEASSMVLVVFAALTFILVLSIIIPGFFKVDLGNFSPFISLGFTPILVAIFFIAESFFGWESATYLSEETKDPEKVIPRSLVIGTAIVAFFVLSISFVSLGIVPWKEFIQFQAPLNQVAKIIYGGAALVGIGVFLSLLGAAMGGVVTMPRLLLALARDKLFLSQFNHVHKKYKTPSKAVIFQTVVSLLVLLIGFGQYKLLLSILLPLGFFMYIAIILAVPILRFKKPDLKRPFKAPFGKVAPFIVVLFIIALFVIWLVSEPAAPSHLMLGVSFALFGIPLYFLIELYNNPKMITRVNDLTAYFILLTERINLPTKVRKEVIELLGDVGSRTVLEYGCSVGTMTMALAKAVGPQGKVYAVDLSENDLRITQRRLEKQDWDSSGEPAGKVQIIHDREQAQRVHPDITYVDAIISVGMMGYLQEIKKVLKDMHRILPEGGKIVFLEYGDFFGIIPNVEWLSKNVVIENVFRDCGFSVHVERKKGLFWNYIYVYGAKLGGDVPFI